jgi:D-3-phosphoglycerate dehydrogenase
MKSLKKYRVLVTPTSYGRDDVRLRAELEAAVGEVIYNPTSRPLSSAELAELLPGCHGYIAGLDTIDNAALQAADQLKVIARYGSGVDRVDVEAAKARGIVVTNTPGANSVSVAELALGLMLGVARSIPPANNATKNGEWPRLKGMSLAGKVIGLIGFGAIGQALARRLQGFDCVLTAFDPYPNVDAALAHNVTLLPLDELLGQADVVSLHMPALPETRGMVNADFLGKMKPGAMLINTARGEIVNEADLLAALQSGHLRGAGLDAFATEPPGADNPLLKLPQVIATPHTGAHTDGATNAMGWGALQACLSVLRGEELQHTELTNCFYRRQTQLAARQRGMKIFRPLPVAGATPLSQFGRGAGGEGLFSREFVANVRLSDCQKRYTHFLFYWSHHRLFINYESFSPLDEGAGPPGGDHRGYRPQNPR